MPSGIQDLEDFQLLRSIKLTRMAKAIKGMKMGKALKGAKGIKLLRLAKIRVLLARSSSSGSINPIMARMSEMILYLSLVWHFTACLYWGVSRSSFYDCADEHGHDPDGKCGDWIPPISLIDQDDSFWPQVSGFAFVRSCLHNCHSL